ncbi:hypothetical protein QFZ98_004480 [Paraburkholderia youngii]
MATGSRRQSLVSRFGGISGSNLACVILKNCCSSAVSLSVTRRSARWCDKFGAGFAHRVKAARRKPGRTWHLDEVFVTLRGEPYLLWRAVDQHGAELDILLQKHRNKAAAKRFFNRVLAACADAPRRIVTDQLRSYPAAKAEIPEPAIIKHVFVKASARVNNRAENSHQPTREGCCYLEDTSSSGQDGLPDCGRSGIFEAELREAG